MKPIEILKNEHGLIRQFLDKLAMAVERLEKGERPPRDFFENAIRFAREFADKMHHEKEELVMFVRLAQKHGGEIDAQIEALRHQHDHARNYISAIASSLDGYEAGQPFQITAVIENTAAYVAMLRRHIHTEDHVFFPMVEHDLSTVEEDELNTQFGKLSEKLGVGVFEENHKRVVDMGSMLVH